MTIRTLTLVARLIIPALLISPVLAQEETRVILRSTIVGNQEQPKVLYILPWQQAEAEEPVYQPLQSLMDDVFQEIDRAVFLRELQYQERLGRFDSKSPARSFE